MDETKLQVYERKVGEITISSPDDMQRASALLTDLNRYKDGMTAEKDKVMRPLLDAQKAERARWKPFETKIDSFIDDVRSAMKKYQTDAKAKAEKEEAKVIGKVEAGRLSLDKGVKKMTEIDRPDSAIDVGDGSVRFRTVAKFEVIDITKLPWEFLIPNETAIRDAMKSDLKLPGVRYYTEEIPFNHR